MTGMHSRTIHSGRLSLSRRLSTTLSRLVRSFIFCLLEVSASSWRSCFERLHQVEPRQQLADGVGPHVGLEGVAVLLAGLAEVLLGQELPLLERGVAGVDDDVVLEVDDPLQAGGLHVQQGAQAAGHRLEEPDVDDRRGQLDVAHPLAADAASASP